MLSRTNSVSRITETKILLLMCVLSFFLCALPYGFVRGCAELGFSNVSNGILRLLLVGVMAVPVNLLYRYTITLYIQN